MPRICSAAMEKGRSANAGFSFALQSLAQLPDERMAARFWNAAGIARTSSQTRSWNGVPR